MWVSQENSQDLLRGVKFKAGIQAMGGALGRGLGWPLGQRTGDEEGQQGEGNKPESSVPMAATGTRT